MNALRARAVTVRMQGTIFMVTVKLAGRTAVDFPLSKIRVKQFQPARLRAVGSAIYDVRIEDRGATIAWPTLDVDFSVAEMLPELLGITTAGAAARRAGRVGSTAKAAAARVNGARGGRPRKKPIAA